MPKPVAESRIQDECEVLNAYAGREIKTVRDLAEFADERGMEPHEVLAAARRHDDLQVELTAEAETTKQVSCLVVPTTDWERTARLATFDVFQDGEQVHATRLIVTDSDGHDAWLDLAPSQAQQVGEWLIREGQRLQNAEREQVPA